jgi:hypothetical protein
MARGRLAYSEGGVTRAARGRSSARDPEVEGLPYLPLGHERVPRA